EPLHDVGLGRRRVVGRRSAGEVALQRRPGRRLYPVPPQCGAGSEQRAEWPGLRQRFESPLRRDEATEQVCNVFRPAAEPGDRILDRPGRKRSESSTAERGVQLPRTTDVRPRRTPVVRACGGVVVQCRWVWQLEPPGFLRKEKALTGGGLNDHKSGWGACA